jgi:intein/homing endonuclease
VKYNSLGRRGLVNFELDILKLYDEGSSIKNICSKLHIGKSTIHNYLKKNNRRRQILHTFDDLSFYGFTPESCYWAGFIAADGCIDKNKYYCRVDLHIDDKSHIEKLLKFTKDKNISIICGNKISTFKNGKACNVAHCYADINSVKIVKDLNDNFNITPAKSFTLRPPIKIPQRLVRHYIRGYFDGDGSIYWNKSHKCAVFSICSGSKDLLNWISNNIKQQVNHNFSKKALNLEKNSSIYSIQQMYSSAQSIFNWQYQDSTPDTRLDRKYLRHLNWAS